MLTIPGRCWLCHLSLAIPLWGICSCCSKHIVSATPSCPQCGLPAISGNNACGRCLQRRPAWDQLIFINHYTSPLRELIHQFKFNTKTALAQTFARLLLLQILEAKRTQRLVLPNAIVTVPLYQDRARSRGYNQSALIAEYLSKWLGCPYISNAVTRIRSSPIQHTLTAQQRKANLKGAFQLDISLKSQHIAIVDDIVTTGSTVTEIAKLMQKQNVATIQVWCLCRTL